MARVALEQALPADWIDKVFEDHREHQYVRELQMSSVVELMSAAGDRGGRPGRESAGLVAADCGRQPPSGKREASGAAARRAGRDPAGPRAGGLDPDAALATDIVAGEDAYESERTAAATLVAGARSGELWIADRHFCTRTLLQGWDAAKAWFIVREHSSDLLRLYWPTTRYRCSSAASNGRIRRNSPNSMCPPTTWPLKSPREVSPPPGAVQRRTNPSHMLMPPWFASTYPPPASSATPKSKHLERDGPKGFWIAWQIACTPARAPSSSPTSRSLSSRRTSSGRPGRRRSSSACSYRARSGGSCEGRPGRVACAPGPVAVVL